MGWSRCDCMLPLPTRQCVQTGLVRSGRAFQPSKTRRWRSFNPVIRNQDPATWTSRNAHHAGIHSIHITSGHPGTAIMIGEGILEQSTSVLMVSSASGSRLVGDSASWSRTCRIRGPLQLLYTRRALSLLGSEGPPPLFDGIKLEEGGARVGVASCPHHPTQPGVQSTILPGTGME